TTISIATAAAVNQTRVGAAQERFSGTSARHRGGRRPADRATKRRARMFSHLSPASLFSLQDKVALITGGAGGIALGLARGFAAAGARLILADRNEAVGPRVEELRRAGADAASLVFDITDASAVDRAFKEAVQRFGRLDIVVNNAAIIVRKPFLELT